MNSIPGLSDPNPIPVTESTSTQAAGPVSRRFWAAALSAVIPGAGQLLLGHIRSAALLLSALATALLLYWHVRLPQWYWGLIVLLLGWIALAIYAVWNALRSPDERWRKASGLWFFPFAIVAFFLSSLGSNTVMRVAGFQLFHMPISSMEPTLIIDDRSIVDWRYYRGHKPRAGEVAVFRRGTGWWVKRVIAVEGDTIFGKSGLVYLNGNLMDEPYVQHIRQIGADDLNDFGPITVPAGQIFVMGDNRDASYDSRTPEFGPVYLNDLAGKPLYIIRSPNQRRIGRTVR